MIVVMRSNCSKENVKHVLTFLEKHGLTGHPSHGVERTVIGVLGGVGPSGTPGSLGGINPTIGESLEAMPGVESVLRVSKPYKLASREFHPEDTVIQVPVPCVAAGVVSIGGSKVVMMAGPCTVESEKQLMTTTEVAMVSEYADILQIGTRNMQNYFLLDEVGRTQKPVVLKRGMSATIEEWLLAAEYILAHGNRNVILCERGIRTFEKITRNTMDISAIPLIKTLSHLPIISDPSQGTGRRDLVGPMSLASIAAGTDGLLIEVHPNPDEALKDGAQSLTIEQFRDLMPQAEAIARAVGREFIVA